MHSIILDTKRQSALWEHMLKKCVIRLGTGDDYRQRKELLAGIEQSLLAGAYSPEPIHGFLSTPKGSGVARFIPVLSFRDLAVYFGCVMAFDEKLASLAVDDTYGGFSLGGSRWHSEEEQAKESFTSALPRDLSCELGDCDLADLALYMPVSAYNRWAWVDSWCQYWKLLAARFEHADEDAYFAMFDIANFYDTIDLPKLERLLRKHCPEASGAIEVLFYLLSIWNKSLNQYARTTKGIPMDIVGDCSRVLANFYLTPFDSVIRERCIERDSSFMRFADDMVIACPDRKTCEELVFCASEELHRIGLNINVAKVRYLTKAEFSLWWAFDIMDAFTDESTCAIGMQMLKSRFENPQFGRKTTALKRSIGVVHKHESLVAWRPWVYETALRSEGFVHQLEHNQLRNLILIADDPLEAIYEVSSRILSAPYTQPKVCLLRCLELFIDHKETDMSVAADMQIDNLRTLDHPVVNLAIKHMPKKQVPTSATMDTAAAESRN